MIRALLLALVLSACSRSTTDASGATPGEARQLNEAAALIDNDSLSRNDADDAAR